MRLGAAGLCGQRRQRPRVVRRPLAVDVLAKQFFVVRRERLDHVLDEGRP